MTTRRATTRRGERARHGEAVVKGAMPPSVWKVHLTFVVTISMLCLLGRTAEPATAQEYRKIVAVRIVGNHHTKPWVIRREMQTQPGDTVDTVQLAEDRDRVFNLNLFERVELTLIPGPEGDTLVVRVWERWYIFPYPVLFISERDFRKFSYGLGVVHLNVAGRAQVLNAEGWLGYNPAAHLEYYNPWIGGKRRLFCEVSFPTASIQSKSHEVRRYDEERIGAKLEVGRRFGYGTYISAGLVYADRRVSPYVPGVIQSPEGRDRFLSVGIQFRLDYRDVRAYPWNGWFLDVAAAQNGLASRWVDYRRFEVDARAYFGNRRWSLASRMAAELSSGSVPNYDRVYFGYRERIRGHFYTHVEGEDRIQASLELKRVLIPLRFWESPLPRSLLPTLKFGLNLVLFVDVGAIANDLAAFRQVRWLKGAGIGLHLRVPYVEAFRLELAFDEHGNPEAIFDLGAFF